MSVHKVIAIIVNWNCWQETVSCVQALKNSEYPVSSIVIVDNGSDMPDPAFIATELANVVALQTGRNLGFAGGVNVGLQKARELGSAFIWLLNPDCRVERDTLGGLLDTMTRDDRIGVVGPKVVFEDKPDFIRHTGGFVVPEEGCRILGSGDWRNDSVLFESPNLKVDYVSGACLLIRSSVIEQIGPMPEDFFLYWEETAWCHLARAHGWAVVSNQLVRVSHGRVKGFQIKPLHYYYYMIRNHLHFVRRFYPHVLSRAVLLDVRRVRDYWRAESSQTFTRRSRVVIACLRGLIDGLIRQKSGMAKIGGIR